MLLLPQLHSFKDAQQGGDERGKGGGRQSFPARGIQRKWAEIKFDHFGLTKKKVGLSAKMDRRSCREKECVVATSIKALLRNGVLFVCVGGHALATRYNYIFFDTRPHAYLTCEPAGSDSIAELALPMPPPSSLANSSASVLRTNVQGRV